jgi:hypothetical protein
VHNPLLVHELPKNSVEDPNPRKAANELRLVFVQARNLPIMDRNALIHRSGGSTDPFLVATLDGDEVSTSVKTKALDPVWLDARQMPVEVLDDDLHVECFDHDETSGPDFVGACVISIRELADRKVHRGWFQLRGRKAGGGLGQETKICNTTSTCVYSKGFDVLFHRLKRTRREKTIRPKIESTSM